MGLDVYMLTQAETKQNEIHNAESDALWERKEAGEITDAEWEIERKKITPYVSSWSGDGEFASKVHGNQLFTRRYLRSSYNDGGFDRAVPEFLGEENKTLWWIFEPLGDLEEGHIEVTDTVKLALCRERAKEVAEKLAQVGHALRVDTVSADPIVGTAEHMWNDVPNSAQALEWYREQTERDNTMGGGWSNAKGMFVAGPGEDGLNVLGMVAGVDVLNRPALHLIYAVPREHVESYRISAEITVEFCEEAIDLVLRDGSVWITWSY